MKLKKRKWYQRKKIIYTVHIVVFLIFIFFFELKTYLSSANETKNLGSFLQSFLWNLDDSSANQYLEIYLQNKPIQSIEVQHPDGSSFLKTESKKQDSIISKIFQFLWLIRNYKLESNIYYDKEHIGKVIIEWRNENIYVYSYASIIFLLLSVVAFFYIETIKHKNELETALREVQELKIQQDADYYLTSLLIKPLVHIKTNFSNFIVEKYMEQKKKFTYKNYKEEIGGDYILVKEIQLKNRNYIFFINADAMGKSLQGGSGILVVGSLLYAISKRLEFRYEDKNKFPETWLKYLCIEIQELFESFQGSMMLSAVIGLIDQQSGILYFANFEHPYPVVYRNGKAFFIGENYIHRKFGMPKMFQENIKVQIFELLEQDILIVGSDGKDDIELQTFDQNKQRIINEDETLFLRIVEHSEADIQLIVDNIKKTGNLTDDLSLLTIQCLRREIPTVEKFPPSDINSIKNFIKELMQSNRYDEAYKALKDYVYMYPLNNDLIYDFVICAYNVKQYEEAIEVGERILTRVEEYRRIYPILIQIYGHIGNIYRSEQLLEEYRKLSPKEPLLNKIKEIIAKKKLKFHKTNL